MKFKMSLCFCFLVAFFCSSAVAQEQNKVIKVSGTGAVSSKPDRARIIMQVTNVNKSIVSGKKLVDEKVVEVQKMLLENGVNPLGINTSGLSLYEERSDPMNRDGSKDVSKQAEYRVTRRIVSQIEDIAKLDEILDSALKLGVNSIQNVEFYPGNIEEIRLKAVGKASDDARKKGEFLAGKFGSKLGKAQQIEYDYRDNDRQIYPAGAVHGGAPSFLQGTIEVTATVNVVYEIE